MKNLFENLRRMIIEKERENSNDNWAECEYFDVCRDCRKGCDAKKCKKDCELWNYWTELDLKEVFKENVDGNGNYLLAFEK